MKINDFVLVMDKESELYRRRCRITGCQQSDTGTTLYTVYSEGLDESETLPETVLELSEFQ